MGIVNATPDSFSDGGLHASADQAIEHGLALVAAGADIVDVGGESTRPGADAVSENEELERISPVVSALVEADVTVSIDTMKPAVAGRAVELGAEIINDVSGFRDPDMVSVAASTGAGVVVMHMQGEPRTMQVDPTYEDVVSDIAGVLVERAGALELAGVAPNRIVVDPGIGFGKTMEHNLELVRHAGRFGAGRYPVLVGPSRKRFLGTITGIEDPAGRDVATAAAVVLAIGAGASVIRVHNVGLVRGAVQVADAIVRATWR